MPVLKLKLLGPFQAQIDKESVSGFESARVRALLTYLTIEQAQPHSRDFLAGLLWPESTDQTARKNLRQALSNLRKVTADNKIEQPYLIITRDTVQFNAKSAHKLDVNDFRSLIRSVDNHNHRRLESCRYCADNLQQAVDLYQGEFLQGFFVDGSVPFQDWVTLMRERFHRQVVQALIVLAEFYVQRAELDLALKCAYRQVEYDPWREAGHQHIMRLLALKGDRSAALKQFSVCKKILANELGVFPSPETQHLYEAIKTSRLEFELGKPPKNNLPAQTTRFVGREHELRQLAALLSDPANRMITLVGSGGVGKTRLAQQAAAEAIYDFPDGVYFVSLASIDTDEMLPTVIAQSLEFAFQGTAKPTDQLINYLRKKEILLVLDNYEHLLDDFDLILQIMQQAPGVVLLITSREPLRLQAEQLVDVSGLTYSEHKAEEELNDALELFQDRARRVNPEYSLGEKDFYHANEICCLVEGLPLAIELAAALTRQWNCREIQFQIQDSLDALTSKMRDLPPRHRSLRATFERSWELLSLAEQGILRQLSIFRAGFTAEAARQIVGAELIDLASLQDRSLLRRNVEGRFDLHPLVEQFSREKLSQNSREQKDVLERCAVFFAGFLQEAGQKLKSNQQPEYLDSIRREFANVQAVWQWFIDQEKSDLIDHSLDALYLYAEGSSLFQDGAALFELALDAQDDFKTRLYWRLSARSGALAYRRGDYSKAQRLLEQSLSAFQMLDERDEEAFVLCALGNLSYLKGKFVEAVQYYRSSLEIARKEQLDYEASQALNGLGLAEYMQGNYPKAKNFLEESLAFHHKIGDPWGNAVRNNNLALVAHAMGDYDEAKDLYSRSLDFWKQIHQNYGLASCYNNLGLVAEALKDYVHARELYTDALNIFEELGHRYGMASCLNNQGNVSVALTEYSQAQSYFEKALVIREELGDQRGRASVLNNLGSVSMETGNLVEAEEYFIRAINIGWGNNALPVVLDCLFGLSKLKIAEGATESAQNWLIAIANHPASNQETIEKATRVMADLDVGDVGDDAVQIKGEGIPLDEIVREILGDTE